MASYPGSIVSLTNPQGGSLVASQPDHAALHTSENNEIVAIETFLGTNSASNGQFSGFTSGQTPLPINSGTLGTVVSKGTVNNMVLGTPAITGGTINNPVIGTPAVTGGTANGQVIGTAVTTGAFNGGTITGTGNGTTNGTINWANGDVQYLVLGTPGTIAYSNQKAWQRLTLVFYQNSTGGYGFTLPTSKYPNGAAPTYGTAANAINAIVVIYDGTNNLTQSAISFA